MKFTVHSKLLTGKGESLIEAYDSLRISSQDGRHYITRKYPATIEAMGSCVVPDAFFHFVKELNEDITVENVGHLLVTHKKGKAKFDCISEVMFPQRPEFNKQIELDVPHKVIKEAIIRQKISKFEGVLSGIKIGCSPLCFASAQGESGYLAHYETEIQGPSFSVVVPPDVFSFIRSDVKLQLSNSHLRFTSDDFEIISPIYVEEFPNYMSRVITGPEYTIDRKELISALKRCSSGQEELNNTRFKFTGTELELTSGGIQEFLDCTGPENDIYFNAIFVADALGRVNTDKVTFEINNAMKIKDNGFIMILAQRVA